MTTEIAIALLTVLGTAISAFVGAIASGKMTNFRLKNWRIKWTSTIISLNAWRSVRRKSGDWRKSEKEVVMAGLSFEYAEEARDAITASQKKEIEGLYKQWAKELGERANYYSHKSAPSYSVAERQMKELMKQMDATSQQVANEVYSGVKKNIYLVADSVVQQNAEWLKSLGFESGTIDAAFNYVPDEIVRNIITGQIYDSGWSLSKRIWSDSEETMKQAYQIVAGGMAQNQSHRAVLI